MGVSGLAAELSCERGYAGFQEAESGRPGAVSVFDPQPSAIPRDLGSHRARPPDAALFGDRHADVLVDGEYALADSEVVAAGVRDLVEDAPTRHVTTIR